MLTRNSPWSNDLDIRLETLKGEFETNLVVALTSASVGYEAAKEVSVRDLARVGLDAYSQPSLSATAIMPRAMTGRASDVPKRYTF